MSENILGLSPGTSLKGRYKIIKILGMGGFGITYKVYDVLENRNCAVKEFVPRGIVMRGNSTELIPLSESKSETFEHGKKRFLEEARILNRLKDIRSVVSVYDFFDENGTSYFVMEYLDGSSLNKIIKKNELTMPVDVVLEIIRKVGEALIEVHKYNIFHRDISPDNIFVTNKGEIKLIDFGNAKNLIRNDDEKLSVVLKPGFAPPEQYSVKGEQGCYTDVYALASTAYYMLTKHKIPDCFDRYKGDNYTPLKELGYPEQVSDAIDHALILKYKERTQTIYDFLVELGIKKTGATYDFMESDDEETSILANTAFKGNEIKPEKQIAPPSNPKPYLQVMSGKNMNKKYSIPENEEIIIGKSANMSHIAFDEDKFMSRQHCKVIYNSSKKAFYIRDISTNGTYVNGIKLIKDNLYMMELNSIVSMGNHICSFKVGVDK